MASPSSSSFPTFSSFFTVLIFLELFSGVFSTEFEVGDDSGWAVPPSKNTDFYNNWASRNRFRVNDTLSFKFEKDSVLVVNEDDYKKCRSDHPLFFSNNGNHTVYTLDRPDLFYFISGVSGHCSRGLKMIIKVMETQTPPPRSANDQTSSGAYYSSSPPSIYAAFLIFIFSFFQAVFL